MKTENYFIETIYGKDNTMITNEQFNNALKKLCIQDSYDSEQYPASVEKILFPKHSLINEAKLLFKYFYQEKGRYKVKEKKIFSQICSGTLESWKLQDYVKFIRTKRDEMFPNDYKKKSRKFISYYKRSTLLSQYEKDLYGKQ